MINWSGEQQDIIDVFLGTEDNIMVDATAGSGKTTLIVEGLAPHMPAGSVAVSFNKKIATELSARLNGTGVKSQTFNAFWFQFLRQRLSSGMKVDGWKVQNLVKKRIPEAEKYAFQVAKLVGLAKGEAIGIISELSDAEQWLALIDMHEFDTEKVEVGKWVEWGIRALKLSNKDMNVIDFDDQMYFSLKLIMERGWKCDVAPVCAVDEAQDVNFLQECLIPYMGERVIAVGDRYQAIYGFRGAGTDSMSRLAETFGMTKMPMNITRRVSLAGVEYAKKFCPTIEAAEGAMQGRVEHLSFQEMVDGLADDCLVVCRNNQPLVQIAFQLLRNGRKFEMSPRFPKALLAWLRKFKATEISELRQRVKDWWEVERKRLESLNLTGTLSSEADKVETILYLCKRSVDVAEIEYVIEQIMDSTGGTFLSTIHGAKGLEALDVIWLAPELCPSKYAVQEWQVQQETNLQFVASTRHKRDLYLVNLREK